MKRFMMVLCVGLILAMTAIAQASIDNFIADSNQFGYSGTVTNVTQNTAPVAFNSTPRDATVYFVNGATATSGYSAYNGYNAILSNWYQHPASNQNSGFFQLADESGVTTTSASGGWTQNGGLWDFTFTVSGANAPYPWSRLWQPDQGMAWGGTFNTYTYTITATGMTTYVAADGWRYNSTNPTGITGSFDGNFTSTQAVYGGPYDLTGRDTYDVHLDLNKNLFDSTNFNDLVYGYGDVQYSTFGAAVPEPATIIIWSLLGGLGLVFAWRKRKIA